MLAERLRQIRLEHNLTQQNIADVLGCDRTTYTLYETATTSPSPTTLYRLAQMYDVTVGYLMGVEKDNHPERKREPGTHELVVSGVDPLSSLSRDEKKLLMSYRILSPEEKKEILDLLRKKAQESPNI